MFKFTMNGRKWVIKETTQEEIKKMQNTRKANNEENLKSIDRRYYGISYMDTLEVFLDEDLPNDRKKATLIHELAHCYIMEYMTHFEKEYNEEDVADIVANSFEIITAIVEKYFE